MNTPIRKLPMNPRARQTTPAVVLASASPARLSVLRAAGIDPHVVASGVDEKAVQAAHLGDDPADLVAELAYAKASAVIPAVNARFDDSVVIGCDSMLWCAGELVGKPPDADAARAQWAKMAAGTAELLTGHALLRVRDGVVSATARATERTGIRFGTPDPDELNAYLATGEPLRVAGALTIDGYGGWFVDGVDGDPSSVIGISLPLTRKLLKQVGISVTDLWRRP
jgi:septum formation protein